MIDIALAVVWVLASYLLGMVSFGDIVAKIAGVNIRETGTKNPGAANFYREVGPRYGIAVFAVDIAKGAVATAPLLAIDGLPQWTPIAAALAVVLGHIFPIFGKRSGGTGMATAIGATFGLAPLGLLAGIPGGLLVLAVLRNPGFAGGFFFLGTALLVGFVGQDWTAAIAVAAVAVVVLAKARLQYGSLTRRGPQDSE